MKPLLFVLPGNETLGALLPQHLACDAGELALRPFPDGESYLRFLTPVQGRDVIFLCGLDRPDGKLLPFYLAASVARELGAHSVGLVTPYLPYMRQDARFQEGEGITAAHFARLISSCCDWLVTVDPHLHRYHALSAIYTAEAIVVPAAPAISAWIAANVSRPLIVGPDSESEQWAAEVARAVGCPYTVLQKQRRGDHDVDVSLPESGDWSGMTPVLVDDIVSTAGTMIAAARQIQSRDLAPPVCIAVHALFAGDAYAALTVAGVDRILSCNTITHASNRIDLSAPIAAAIAALLANQPAPSMRESA